MKTHKIFLFFLGLVVRSSFAGSIDDVVARHYPTVLSELATEFHDDEQRQQAWAPMISAGKNYLVAAYSNGSFAALELLEPVGNDASVRQLIRKPLDGYDPDLSLVDVDGDGQPEVVVSFVLGPRGGAATWIYRLKDGLLVNISPIDKFGESDLEYPDILDMDSTGKMDLVQKFNVSGSRIDPVMRSDHYALQNGTYAARQPLDFYKIFYREKGSPVIKTETFSIPANALDKPYRVTIVNGGERGADARVTAGTVKLNGVTIAAPSDFRQARASWTLPITLQAENTITVRLEGEKGSQIAVAIRHD